MSSEVTVFEPSLPITKEDLKGVKERRRILKEFIRDQMIEGIDNDYAIVPGTQKRSLLKPGAEKLSQLFGLGVRIVLKDKEIDLHLNFAMFSYTMEVYHLRTGAIVSQCEGSCNSYEKKYRFRSNNGAKEEAPIGDLMNTLMKMAQKRGYVGAVIQATGASDFYTQDVDDAEDREQLGIKPSPAKATAKVNVKSAKSTDENSAPRCCEKPMMASKYHQNTWYCPACKSTQPMHEAAASGPTSSSTRATPAGISAEENTAKRDQVAMEVGRIAIKMKMNHSQLLAKAKKSFGKDLSTLTLEEIEFFKETLLAEFDHAG